MAREDDRADERVDAPEGGGPRKVQTAERRAWVRYPRRLTTMWQLFGARQEETWDGSLFDVSQTGLGLIINRSFPPSTVLSVRLQTAGRKAGRAMLVRVRHCSPRENGEWLVGCTFVVKLKDAELKDLIS